MPSVNVNVGALLHTATTSQQLQWGDGGNVAQVQNANTHSRIYLRQTSHTVNSAGRWIQVQGYFKRRAHIASISGHVGIGQYCRAIDVESPTILPTTSTRNVPAGRWKKCLRTFKGERTKSASFLYTFESISVASPPVSTNMPPPCQEKRRRVCSSGAMEEMSRQGKKASTHLSLRCHEYCSLQS